MVLIAKYFLLIFFIKEFSFSYTTKKNMAKRKKMCTISTNTMAFYNFVEQKKKRGESV